MYDITTKRNGHLKVRNAAKATYSYAQNDKKAMLLNLIATIDGTQDQPKHFLGIAKKITKAVVKKGLDKVQKDAAKTVGAEKAAQMRTDLEKDMAANKEFQKKLNTTNTMGDIVIASMLVGGAMLAAPALGAGGAAVGGAGGATAGVGAGATVSAAEVAGMGATAIGAGTSLIKKPSTQPLKDQVDMPDKDSMQDILGPIAKEGLQASGKSTSGKTTEQTIKQFLKDVASPITGKDYSGLAKDAAEKAMADFVGTLANKKKAGEKLPPVQNKVAGSTIKTQNTISANQDAINKNVTASGEDMFEWIKANPWIIALALGLLWLAARHAKKGGK